MTSTPQDTWKDYFTTFSNMNIMANRHLGLFLDVSTPSRDCNLKIDQLSKDQGNSIMLYYASITNSIHFLRSLLNLGSTTWDPTPILVVALSGFSSDKAYTILFDIDSLFNDISTNAPTFTRHGNKNIQNGPCYNIPNTYVPIVCEDIYSRGSNKKRNSYILAIPSRTERGANNGIAIPDIHHPTGNQWRIWKSFIFRTFLSLSTMINPLLGNKVDHNDPIITYPISEIDKL